MKFKFNPFTTALDIVDAIASVFTSDPSPAEEGQIIINSTSNQVKIYYGGVWNVLATLTPPATSLLLLEDSFKLLMENGDNFALE